MSFCFYYVCQDESKEILGKSHFTRSRLEAAKEFAKQKQLPLKEFLKIWAVGKKGMF
jgi:hypothetical protein